LGDEWVCTPHLKRKEVLLMLRPQGNLRGEGSKEKRAIVHHQKNSGERKRGRFPSGCPVEGSGETKKKKLVKTKQPRGWFGGATNHQQRGG